MALNRDAILEKDDLKRESVTVSEWGGDVFVKELTGTERDKFEAESFSRDGGKITYNFENQRARLLVACLCDEAGNRLFTDEDMPRLGNKSGAVLDRLFTVAQRINSLTPAAIEDAAKN